MRYREIVLLIFCWEQNALLWVRWARWARQLWPSNTARFAPSRKALALSGRRPLVWHTAQLTGTTLVLLLRTCATPVQIYPTGGLLIGLTIVVVHYLSGFIVCDGACWNVCLRCYHTCAGF